MQISSMTGFARQSGRCEWDNESLDWQWEIKSVNGKGLDLKSRLPSGWDELAGELKNTAQKYFERGSLSAVLEISGGNDEPKIKINHEMLQQLTLTAIEIYRKNPDFVAVPTAGELLSVSGVITAEKNLPDEKVQQWLQQELLAGFAKACAKLQQDRQREGEKIAAVLSKMVNEIEALTAEIAQIAALAPQILRQRLEQQIADLTHGELPVAEERIAQEVVLLVNRADVREEIDRLQAHIRTARQLLASEQTLGRRFDFLCQEFNRESNTICSKAYDIEIINRGMALKAVIEQLREQVQNME